MRAIRLFFIIAPIVLSSAADFMGLDADTKDLVFGVCLYVMIAALFETLHSLKYGKIFFLLFILSLGKVVDQFYDPYGFHRPEIITDIILVLIWIMKTKWEKKPLKNYGTP